MASEIFVGFREPTRIAVIQDRWVVRFVSAEAVHRIDTVLRAGSVNADVMGSVVKPRAATDVLNAREKDVPRTTKHWAWVRAVVACEANSAVALRT